MIVKKYGEILQIVKIKNNSKLIDRIRMINSTLNHEVVNSNI